MTRLLLALALLVLGPRAAGAADAGAALVSRMWKLEHQSAESVLKAIRHLGSGGREARLDADDRLDVITARDLPANVAAIDQAVKTLDVPRPDVSFHMRLLIAGTQGAPAVPEDIEKIVRQLQQTLQWKSYRQVAAVSQRVRSGARLESKGTVQLGPPTVEKPERVEYELELRPVVTGNKRGARTIQLRTLKFELEGRELGKADIRTDLVVQEGETVVVGTAALGTSAMVLIVWAQVL